jgi:hypothetical protein
MLEFCLRGVKIGAFLNFDIALEEYDTTHTGHSEALELNPEQGSCFARMKYGLQKVLYSGRLHYEKCT